MAHVSQDEEVPADGNTDDAAPQSQQSQEGGARLDGLCARRRRRRRRRGKQLALSVRRNERELNTQIAITSESRRGAGGDREQQP